jgi:ATP-binding cassette subfamily B protein
MTATEPKDSTATDARTNNLMSLPRRWYEYDRRMTRLRVELLRLLPRASPALTAGVVVVLLISSTVTPLLIISVGDAVSSIAPAVQAGAGSAVARNLIADLVLVGVLYAVGQACDPLLSRFADQLGLRAMGVVFRRIVSAHLEPPSVAHLEDPDLKDLVDHAQQQGIVGTRAAVRGLILRWSARLSGVGGIVLLGLFRWWAGLSMLAAVIFAVRRLRVAHIEISRNLYAQSRILRHANYLRDLLLRPGAEKEVRIFGLAPWIMRRVSHEWHSAMEPVWARRRRSAVDTAFAIGPAVLLGGFITAVAAHDALGHSIGLGELVVVLQATVISLGPRTVSTNDTQAELGVAAIEATEKLEAGVQAHSLHMVGTRPVENRPEHEVRFDGVRFTYPKSRREVLAGVDFVIPARTSVAIVGDNGAGKTTLIKLLSRLCDPNAGTISVDGVDLKELDPYSWQQRTAAVFQDFVHYPWTVAENIALHPDVPEDVTRAAAKRAGALGIIEALPDGWHTPLSRSFGGVDLSGGEWQRIALARALCAVERGAALLILDEPTAHLDVRQEAAFYEQFLELTRGLTTIVVSHRFSTVRRADNIVVLEAGRITESGHHDELVAANGRYARMFALQARRFTEGDGHD